MNELSVNLKNCYGIPSLEYKFTLSEATKVAAVYASNGSMKTSLAKTFKDLENNTNPKDEVFPDRVSQYDVLIDNERQIENNEIVVIESFADSYDAKSMSLLLVNDKLRKKYENARQEVDALAKDFLNDLRKRTLLTGPATEKEIINVFTSGDEELIVALSRLKVEIELAEASSFSHIHYGDLFNSSTEKLISDPKFIESLQDYIKRYEDLISQSQFFRKGVFDHSNAAAIQKGLQDNGFFEAQHSIAMSSSTRGENKIVTTDLELNTLIENELKGILSDSTLKKNFTSIDTKLGKSKAAKALATTIKRNPELAAKLLSPESLKKELLKAYIKDLEAAYQKLVETYVANQRVIQGVMNAADKEKTIWESVVNDFNNRFKVPFKVEINQRQVILDKARPVLKFRFYDGRSDKVQQVSQDSLLRVLSGGERRAFYLLNVLFEVEARKQKNETTVFIIDDIADSFDYRNKYAILQYIREMGQQPNFRLITLTHNFDFFRAISLRLGLKAEQRLIAERSASSVVIRIAKHAESPFNDWRKSLNSTCTVNELIATIPFVRTLVDYTGHDESFMTLTRLLHLKEDSDEIKWSTVVDIYKNHLAKIDSFACVDLNNSVISTIKDQGVALAKTEKLYYELSEKIVLAIAIRLRTEEIIQYRLTEYQKENPKTTGIVLYPTPNQTKRLCGSFTHWFKSTDPDTCRIFDKVQIITPEHLHINSFMYEPLIDLSGESLRELYNEVDSLGAD